MVIKKTSISPQYLRKDEVYVSILEIKSPSHFIVKESPSINTSSDAKKFVEAEEMMQKYYHSLENEFFQVPLKDSIVVVQHKQKYYRAQVRSIFSVSEGHLFKVYLLDYGQECNIPRQHLYEIHRDFLVHNYQAVELKLLDVEPISLVVSSQELKIDYGPVSTWDPSAVAFIEDMSKAMNSAHVKVKGVGENFLFGGLYMTLDSQKVLCVNEELKKKKFAQQKEDFWNNVIPIDAYLPKVGLNFTRRRPGIACTDSDPSNPSPSEYTSTPTLSPKPESHTVESSPPAAVGSPSAAVGSPSAAVGSPSAAVGSPSAAVGSPSTAVGSPSTAVGSPSTAVGSPSTAVGSPSTAVGSPSTAVGSPSTAVGSPSTAVGSPSTAVRSPKAAVTPNSQNDSLNKFQKLQQLMKRSSTGQPNSTAVSPVAADCGPNRLSTSLNGDKENGASNNADQNKSKPQENVAANKTPNKIEICGQSQLQKLMKYNSMKSPSPQKPPDSSTPLKSQVSSSPLLSVQTSCGRIKASVIEGISPITGTNLGLVSPRKSEADSSSMKDKTNSLNLAFMNSTQPKDIKKLSELSEIEKSNGTEEKSPKVSSLNSAAKFQALRNLCKKRTPDSPKPESKENLEEKTQMNSSPSVETIPRSGLEASLLKYEEEYLEGFSGAGDVDDVLDCVLNPKRIPANDSGLSSPDSSRNSSISNDSITELQPMNAMDFSDKSLWEKQKVPALCIGEAIPSPLLSTGEASFPSALQKTLDHLNFCGPSCIQSVVWPAVERRRCLAAVAPPHSGKTVAYLLPLVANFMSPVTHADLPKSDGPIVIIICSSWKKVQAVYDLFQTFLSGTKCKILSFFSGLSSKRNRVAALLNGCDVLISVPSCLLDSFKDNVLCVRRCCHFILDDGSTLLSQNMKELKEVMQHLARKIELRCPVSVSLQILICAERWSKGVASFVDKFMHTPLLLFTSFLEAAVYAQVPMHVHICDEKDKTQYLLDLLEKSKRSIICTNNSSKAFEIHDFLKCENVRSFLVNEEMEHYISDGVIQDWKSVRSTAVPHCLVLTDTAFTHLKISDANILIHYDIPEMSRLQFGNRFSCIAEHFKHSENGTPDCACHILVSGDCSRQAPSLLKLVQRSGVAVSSELKELVTKQTVKRNIDAPLCHYMKAFGACTLINCQQRHFIDPVLDKPNITPHEGDVSALVTHICDPTHLYVRILQYLSPELTLLSGSYAKIGFQLKHFFSIEANRTKVEDPAVGKTYILRDENELYYRVKVMAIIPATQAQRQKIKFLFCDEGWVLAYDNCHLFEYIEANQFPPPLVVEVYLCGLCTPDTSLDWNPQANRFMSRLIEGKEIHGKIVLCLGETLWLHPVVLRKKLIFTNDYLNVLSLDKSLKDAEYAMENNNHLPMLIAACENKIPLPKEIKRTPLVSKIEQEEAPQYSYAFLEFNVCENVFVSSVISPHEFYVQREKFVKCLDELLDKIEVKIKANELEKCRAFQNGMHCLAPFHEDNSYYRAEITEVIPDSDDVQVFFVDFGDFGRVATDSIFILPPQFSLLPFQAIKCELDGICAPHGGWTDKAGDTLYHLTRNEDGDMNILQIMAYKKSQQYGNGNHYIVDLWYSDKSIADQLLSAGLVSPAEKLAPAQAPAETKWEDKDMLQEVTDGYAASSDEGMDEEDKVIHAKFCAAMAKLMFGPPSSAPTEEGAAGVEKVKENVKPKVIPKKRAKKSVEVEIRPLATRSPFLAMQRLINCRNKEPKRAKPFIKWWNTIEHVNILINLRDIEIYELDVRDEKFIFSTSVRGMDYHTIEEFFSSVYSNETITKNTAEGLNIILQKQTCVQWPQLTKNKFPHIKYDLNHIDDSDSEEMTEEVPDAEMQNPDESMVAHYDSEDNASSGDDEEYIQPWKKLAQFKDPFDPLD